MFFAGGEVQRAARSVCTTQHAIMQPRAICDEFLAAGRHGTCMHARTRRCVPVCVCVCARPGAHRMLPHRSGANACAAPRSWSSARFRGRASPPSTASAAPAIGGADLSACACARLRGCACLRLGALVSAGASPTNSRSTRSRTPPAVTSACKATQATYWAARSLARANRECHARARARARICTRGAAGFDAGGF